MDTSTFHQHTGLRIAQKQQQRLESYVEFLDKCKTNFKKTKDTNEYCEWNDTVTIKLDASNKVENDYANAFGTRFLDEETLIVCDDNNNVLIVFQDDNKVVTKNITPIIHVLNKLRLDSKCLIHKQIEPAQVPPHIRINLNFIQNNTENYIQNADTIQNVNTIHNNFAGLNIQTNMLQEYLDTYLKNGVACPLKQLSKHPEWKPEYRNRVETRKMNICKSCNKKWLKGCCQNYSRNNRTIWTMVTGLHD